ncbi:hypothetical protein PRK78_006663 [Emydomyces testavorans]|uniref:Saccharopine dehydrogenase NADP binding domain-containing protein n=1 Tax=Emydomyces testavorans TaxID=2070801 RepID=A0AAF0DMJ2_9EURO|nr:hypothetical protein PRK78_006663 [Emydomyces testavorans]
MDSSRELDIVVLGAYGYTGRHCVEHIAHNLPTTLKWGIAGRSAQKLESLAADLKKDGPDRKAPEILPVQLNDTELETLVRKTKVLLNFVGPYQLYSAPVVKACANNGTHYIDTERNVFPNGEKEIKEPNLEVVLRRGAGISGGTAASIITSFSNLSLKELRASNDPYCLSVLKPTAIPPTPISRKLFGAHYVKDLGTVTTTLPAMCDSAIVHRSSSMMPDLYDRNFYFQEYSKVRNTFIGLAMHIGLGLVAISLMLPPVRWIAKKSLPKPGQGPSKEDTARDHVEYRGIGTADPTEPGKKPIRLMGRLTYRGPAYPMTGMLLAEAAMVLLTSERVGKEIKAGYLTPAMLGKEYVDRVEKCGVEIETQVLED